MPELLHSKVNNIAGNEYSVAIPVLPGLLHSMKKIGRAMRKATYFSLVSPMSLGSVSRAGNCGGGRAGRGVGGRKRLALFLFAASAQCLFCLNLA